MRPLSVAQGRKREYHAATPEARLAFQLCRLPHDAPLAAALSGSSLTPKQLTRFFSILAYQGRTELALRAFSWMREQGAADANTLSSLPHDVSKSVCSMVQARCSSNGLAIAA